MMKNIALGAFCVKKLSREAFFLEKVTGNNIDNSSFFQKSKMLVKYLQETYPRHKFVNMPADATEYLLLMFSWSYKGNG